MQAAFISYALFTALFLLIVLLLVIIVGVRSLLAFIRGSRRKDKALSTEQPRASDH
jgi:hypothetical protein